MRTATAAVVTLSNSPRCELECLHQVAYGFSDVDALTALLTVESLLLAVLALAVTIGTPDGRRVRKQLLPAKVVGWATVALTSLLAAAGVCAWLKIFGPDFPRDLPGRAIACSLLIAIVGEPLLAAVLAVGLHTEK
jgi:hypothetical protein